MHNQNLNAKFLFVHFDHIWGRKGHICAQNGQIATEKMTTDL